MKVPKFEKINAQIVSLSGKNQFYNYNTKITFKSYELIVPYYYTTLIVDKDDNIHIVEPFKYSSLEIIKSSGNIHQPTELKDSDTLDIIKDFPQSYIAGVIFEKNLEVNSIDFNYLSQYLNNIYVIYKVDSSSGTRWNKLIEIVELLAELYGDNFDIQKINGEISRYRVVLKYPKIVIKNSEKKSHEIEDLYVYFSIQYNIHSKVFYISERFRGYRGKRTFEEYNTSYTHSHLSGQCGSFCMGSSQLGNILQLELFQEYSPKNMVLTAMVLDAYLEWESLEGGPHNRIERITSATLPPLTSYPNHKTIKTYTDSIINDIKDKNIVIPVRYVNTTLSINTLLVPYILNIDLQEMFCDKVDKVYRCYYIDGSYVDKIEAKDAEIVFSQRSNLFVFKEKDIPDIVIKKSIVTEANKDRITTVIHPEVSIYIANNLTKLIQEKWQKQ